MINPAEIPTKIGNNFQLNMVKMDNRALANQFRSKK